MAGIVNTYQVIVDAAPAPSNDAALAFLSMSPIVGPTAGGQLVTINGRNFRNITQVTLGGAVLTGLSVIDEFTIQGTTSARSAGLVDLIIESSSVGFLTVPRAYTYVGGFGTGSNDLLLGKQLDDSLFRQNTYTGETANLGVDTEFSFTLDDIPTHPEAVELYIKRVGTNGGALVRQGATFAYTVDVANRKITWKASAPYAIAPGDEITVCFLGRGEF